MKKDWFYSCFKVFIIVMLALSTAIFIHYCYIYFRANCLYDSTYIEVWKRVSQKDLISTSVTFAGAIVAMLYTVISERKNTARQEREKVIAAGCYFVQFDPLKIGDGETNTTQKKIVNRLDQQLRVIYSEESYKSNIPYVSCKVSFVTTTNEPKMVKMPLVFSDDYFKSHFVKCFDSMKIDVKSYLEFCNNVHYATVPVMAAVPLSYLGKKDEEANAFLDENTVPFVIPLEGCTIGAEHEETIWFGLYNDSDYLTFIETKIVIKPDLNQNCKCTLMQEIPHYLIDNKLQTMAY